MKGGGGGEQEAMFNPAQSELFASIVAPTGKTFPFHHTPEAGNPNPLSPVIQNRPPPWVGLSRSVI